MLHNIKNVHFIGIGGSGMYPMATILKEKGYNITGSDIYESDNLQKVKNMGISVSIGHKPENIKNSDLIVYTAATKMDNPEIVEAKKNNIPIMERCEMLGLISDKYKNSIGVSGTHGKTTTTAMIAHILLDAKKSPTAIIGGTLQELGGNSHTGNSDIFVCEACEYVDSFLHLHPKFSIILNIDADHLDYFKTLENIKKSFKKFVNQTKNLVIFNGDCKNTLEIVKDIDIKKISFGLNQHNDYFAQNIKLDDMQIPTFDLMYQNKKISEITLGIRGKHNIYNSLSAIVMCIELGVDINTIKDSIKNFTGADRRFEILDTINGITVVNDFAHHPTEIKATLDVAMNMNYKRVWVVFQPHTFSRTSMFLNEFAKVLSVADKVIITDILPVREENTFNISAQDLGNKIKNSTCVKNFDDVVNIIEREARQGDMIIAMGGGNIYKCANMILNKLKNI